MESHQKEIFFDVEVFFSSPNIHFPFYFKRLLELFLLRLLRTWGF
jgi:hypothetical protein